MSLLDIAQGSCFELETQVILSFDLDYISEDDVKVLWNKIDEVQKMIDGFSKSLKK